MGPGWCGSGVVLGTLSHGVDAAGESGPSGLPTEEWRGIWGCHSSSRGPISGTRIQMPVFKWLQKASVLTSRVFDLGVGAPGGGVKLLHSASQAPRPHPRRLPPLPVLGVSQSWRLLHFPASCSLSFSHFLPRPRSFFSGVCKTHFFPKEPHCS